MSLSLLLWKAPSSYSPLLRPPPTHTHTCSSASMSLGLLLWKAPLQTKRMWSVLTVPYFVVTADPSMMGSRSRCTPSLLTRPLISRLLGSTILSISSMNCTGVPRGGGRSQDSCSHAR